MNRDARLEVLENEQGMLRVLQLSQDAAIATAARQREKEVRRELTEPTPARFRVVKACFEGSAILLIASAAQMQAAQFIEQDVFSLPGFAVGCSLVAAAFVVVVAFSESVKRDVLKEWQSAGTFGRVKTVVCLALSPVLVGVGFMLLIARGFVFWEL